MLDQGTTKLDGRNCQPPRWPRVDGGMQGDPIFLLARRCSPDRRPAAGVTVERPQRSEEDRP
jgi:hypothetical protein